VGPSSGSAIRSSKYMCIVEMKTGTIILGSLASPSGSLHEIEKQTLFCELVFSSLYLNLYE
jgi:hypothetical protein